MDSDPEPIESASFGQIWIGIQGLLSGLGSGSVPILTNVKLNYIFSRKLQYTIQNIENYDTYEDDAEEKDKIM